MSPLPKPIGQPWRHFLILTLTIDNRSTQNIILQRQATQTIASQDP
jgi:hypothetical protein